MSRVASEKDAACTPSLGDKRMDHTYLGQMQGDDNEGYTAGWDHDTIRYTSPSYPPQPDTNNGSGWGEQKFGSSHTNGLNIVLADGSVRFISARLEEKELRRLIAPVAPK